MGRIGPKRRAELWRILDALSDEMGIAMRRANLEYVAFHGSTPHMLDVVARYEMFAQKHGVDLEKEN